MNPRRSEICLIQQVVCLVYLSSAPWSVEFSAFHSSSSRPTVSHPAAELAPHSSSRGPASSTRLLPPAPLSSCVHLLHASSFSSGGGFFHVFDIFPRICLVGAHLGSSHFGSRATSARNHDLLVRHVSSFLQCECLLSNGDREVPSTAQKWWNGVQWWQCSWCVYRCQMTARKCSQCGEKKPYAQAVACGKIHQVTNSYVNPGTSV